MNKKPLISIIIAFNDLKSFHGGSKNGIKEKIDYFNQFLMLYESVNENWGRNNFNYNFYVVHSIPFSDDRLKILESLNLNIVLVNYDKHKTKIRPMCYKIPIECDYRLVLDTDMIALKEPNFNFKYDALALYGGNKYNKSQWKKICQILGCQMPKKKVRIFRKGKYNEWSIKEHYLYHMGKIKDEKFPHFNNGAILIKNDLTPKFVNYWENYRRLYTEYVKKEFNMDIDLEGQDVVGLAINQSTNNWSLFEKGFNFAIQEKLIEGKKLINEYSNIPSLLHYINVTSENKYYDQINFFYEKILKKYYKK